MNDWQPKETAPQDGTRIIVWDIVHGYMPWVFYEDDEWISSSLQWSGKFSHWMPIPRVPK